MAQKYVNIFGWSWAPELPPTITKQQVKHMKRHQDYTERYLNQEYKLLKQVSKYLLLLTEREQCIRNMEQAHSADIKHINNIQSSTQMSAHA